MLKGLLLLMLTLMLSTLTVYCQNGQKLNEYKKALYRCDNANNDLLKSLDDCIVSDSLKSRQITSLKSAVTLRDSLIFSKERTVQVKDDIIYELRGKLERKSVKKQLPIYAALVAVGILIDRAFIK